MYTHGIIINDIEYGRDRNIVPYDIEESSMQRTADGTLTKEIAFKKQGIKVSIDYLTDDLRKSLYNVIDNDNVVDIEYYEAGKDEYIRKKYICTERPNPEIRSWDLNVPNGQPPKPIWAKFELTFEEV